METQTRPNRFFQTIPPALRHCAVLGSVAEVHLTNGRETIVHRELGSVDILHHPVEVSFEVGEALRKAPLYGQRFVEIERPNHEYHAAMVEKKRRGETKWPEIDKNNHEKAKDLLRLYDIEDEEMLDKRGRFSKFKIEKLFRQLGLETPNY